MSGFAVGSHIRCLGRTDETTRVHSWLLPLHLSVQNPGRIIFNGKEFTVAEAVSKNLPQSRPVMVEMLDDR